MLTTGAVHEHLGAVEAWEGADFSALDVDSALDLAAAAARTRHALDAIIARSLGRVDQACENSPGSMGPARRRGVASSAALASRVTGLGPGEAHRLIEMGRSLLRADAAAKQAEREASAVVQSPADAYDDYPSTKLLDPGLPADQTAVAPLCAPPDAADAPHLMPPELAPTELAPPDGAPAAATQVPPQVPGAILAAAVDAGRLDKTKEEVIRATLADFTIDTSEIERDFVEFALHNSLGMLKKHCFGLLGELDPEGLALREIRQISERFLSVTDGADGMITMFGKFDVGTGAVIKTRIDELVGRGMRAQRKMPKHMQLTPGQIAADAMSDIVKHAASCTKIPKRAKTTLVVRIDKDALAGDLRDAGRLDDDGRPVALGPGAIGSCDGVAQPVTATMLRMMAVDAQILPAVMGGKPIPLDMGRATRLYSPGQKLAIAERDRGCISCPAPPAFCDTHHIELWSEDGKTDVDNGALMCTGCHHRLHEQFWRVEVTASGASVVKDSGRNGAPPWAYEDSSAPPWADGNGSAPPWAYEDGSAPPAEHRTRPERPAT